MARGFANMPLERRCTLAAQGGRTAHQNGAAHQFTSTEASEAGRKGGLAVSKNRDHMREIGRKGGAAGKGRTSQKQATASQQI